MRDVKIAHDLESTPLEIKTVANSEWLSVNFFDITGDMVGELNVLFMDSSLPEYQIGPCAEFLNFSKQLPDDTIKIWTITKLAGPGMTIQCNAEKVVDVLISPTTCATSESDWTRQVGQIEFGLLASESDFYRPAASGYFIRTCEGNEYFPPVFLCVTQQLYII